MVDPNGNSFDPEIIDTVSFTTVGNPEFCEPGGLMAYAGDGRNILIWNEPFAASSENPFPATPDLGDYNTGTSDGFSIMKVFSKYTIPDLGRLILIIKKNRIDII